MQNIMNLFVLDWEQEVAVIEVLDSLFYTRFHRYSIELLIVFNNSFGMSLLEHFQRICYWIPQIVRDYGIHSLFVSVSLIYFV